ncbi:hypothetical protein Scep_023166 [Stephania cephalantha]|uniref:Uncharacterized protein n=1 Tax=Stephania cephalantha TaxID=152367 RepID=A0AAP0HX23_9MAGN
MYIIINEQSVESKHNISCPSSLENPNLSVSKQVYLIIQKESSISDKWKGLFRYPQMISPSCGAFPCWTMDLHSVKHKNDKPSVSNVKHDIYTTFQNK